MKQHAGNSKPPPPPARSASFRARGEHSAVHTLPSMDVSDCGLMVSPDHSGDISPCYGEKALIKVSTKDINDCISGWLTYLQSLNGLCGAGSRLSHSLGLLLPPESQSPCGGRAAQCQAAWDDLSKVIASTSNSIRPQVVQALQELTGPGPGPSPGHAPGPAHSPGSNDPGQVLAPAQQAVVCHSLMTLISLQYQFCMACCECLGMMAPCHCCPSVDSNQQRAHDADCIVTILQHYFNRLYVPPVPAARSPLLFPLWPFQSPQRRWSEAAAREVSGSSVGDTLTAEDGAMRRWSMPWDTSGQCEQQGQWSGRLYPKDNKLTVPGGATSQERSRSTTPESLWHSSMASQEELSDVITLLSCRPNQPLQLYQASQHVPGVTLTGCGHNTPSPSHQASWSGHSAGHSPSEDRPAGQRGSTSPILPAGLGRLSPHQNTQQPSPISNPPAIHIPMWVEGTVMHTTPPPDVQRKGSSSTDTSSLSSSLSLHRSSTSSSDAGALQEGRSHLYSMWSGADLPFIKLPENSEVPTLSRVSSSPRGSPHASPSSQRFVQ